MVERYATNQFYNFNRYESGIGNPNKRTDQDNPKFLWPKDSYKNAVNGEEGPYPAKTTRVQRGYLRMITDAYGDKFKDLGSRRLHFQFNPDTLTRMVTARNDVQLWQNQDPFQFVQPIPGDSNFSFDLLFNREAEIASASYMNENGKVVLNDRPAVLAREVKRQAGHPSLKGTVPYFVENDYNPSWVTDIGVLADLMVFDQIIGQGMNKNLIQAIVDKAQAVTSAYNKSKADSGNTSDEEDKDQGVTFDYNQASSFLGTNIGNSAFLVAQPIRVVFSSSFMVEGFVTSTTVVFNKFNAAMVPTQCHISVQMQAMYIGFASKDTYLTQVFKEYKASEAFGSSSDEDNALNASLVPYGKDLFDNFGVTNAAVDLFKYNLNPERILNKDDNDTSQFEVIFYPSATTKEFAKNNAGTISSTIRFVLTYLGKAGGGSEGGYAINEEVHRGTASADFNMSALKGNNTTVKYIINQPTYSTLKPWDTDNNAKYKLNVVIYYHIVGASGGEVDALQVAVAERELTWKQVWRVGTSLEPKEYSDEQLQDILNDPTD
jgi:hypothetical protein